MKLIDRDELLATFERDADVSVTGRRNAEEVKRVLQTIYDDIKDSPVVDAVPVIRCKDCKYYREGECWCEHDNDGWEYYQSVIENPLPDDFCSEAERKEE